jgi:hypothetical protein
MPYKAPVASFSVFQKLLAEMELTGANDNSFLHEVADPKAINPYISILLNFVMVICINDC